MLVALTLQGSLVQAQDCIQETANFHGVNEVVLRAIAWHESRMDPSAVGRNSNDSVDVGRVQTKSMHLQELAQNGITPQHLLDACVSDYVGTWLYARKITEARL